MSPEQSDSLRIILEGIGVNPIDPIMLPGCIDMDAEDVELVYISKMLFQNLITVDGTELIFVSLEFLPYID